MIGIDMVKRFLMAKWKMFTITIYLTNCSISAQVKRNKISAGGLYIFRMYIDSKSSGSSEMFILSTRGIR